MADKDGVEFSSEEFQQRLFDWFDQRGLLKELRTFMRHRMISALYNADSPCSTLTNSRFSSETTVSPTLQAFLLLVAEFLVQQEYHYTMSVMVAEVPLLATLPKFSHYVTYMSNADAFPLKKSPLPRFSEKDLKEILELMGIAPESESCQHIHRLYNNNGARESLLACTLTALAAIAQHNPFHATKQQKAPENTSINLDDSEDFTKWLEEVRLVLLRGQLTSLQMRHVEELLWNLYSNSVSKVRKEEQDKQNQQLQIYERQLQADALLREEQFRAEVEQVENDLKKKQLHLQQVTSQLRQQHDEVLSRLNRVQKHANEIQRQENELKIREKQATQKEKLLEKEQQVLADLQLAASSLQQEKSDNKALIELRYLQERCSNLEAELNETKAQLYSSALLKVEIGVQTTQKISECSEKHQDRSSASSASSFSFSACNSPVKLTCEKQPRDRNNQIILLKRVLRRVQQENSELRANASQQRRRIDELTTRAAQLAAHIAVDAPTPAPAPTPSATVGQPLPAGSPVPTHAHAPAPASVAVPPSPQAPPPPPPPPVPPRHSRHSGPVGAGGDLKHPSARHPTYSARLQGREWRRKPPKRLLQHSSLTTSLSSDDSPTEEVLREARNRLRRLEEESEVADRRYRDFQARQADSLASTASLLFVPAQDLGTNMELSDPLLQARRHPLSTLATRAPAGAAFSLATGVAPSLRSASGLFTNTNVPISAQSQFTLPEPSAYNPPSLSRPSFRSDEPIPHRPAVLRRPGDRIKDLFNARAFLLQSLVTDTDHGSEKKIENSENRKTDDVPGALKITEGGVIEGAGVPRIGSGSQNVNDLPTTADAMVDPRDASSEVISASLRDLSIIKSNRNLSQDQDVNHEKNLLASLSNCNSPEHKVLSKPSSPASTSKIQVASKCSARDKCVASLPPLPQRVESLSSHDEIIMSNKDKQPARVETTLNEVSTLSSSPVVEDLNILNTADAAFLAPSLDHKNAKEKLDSQNSDPCDSTPANHPLNNIEFPLASTPGSQIMRHIPNPSVSSIELSDQVISIGSDGKRTGDDDDDDFW